MKLERHVIRPYALPLKASWRAAGATLSERRGALIGLFAEGLIGWGDCAPLPSSGAEGHAHAFAALDHAAGALRGATLEAAFAGLVDIASPQARWAVETALLDLSARQNGLPLHRALGGKPTQRLVVNAAAGVLDDACTGRVAAARADGFGIVKIKVGVAPPAEELRRLRAMSDGGVRFRLDANRAWSAEDARAFLNGIADLPIDGVEEPLERPTLKSLRALQDRCSFPLAVDESLFELGPSKLFSTRTVRRLVLKPARIGGFGDTLHLVEQASAAGMDVVITSVVDSAIGVAAAAQLAAVVDASGAHGLATSSWLARDVATPLTLDAGALVLPENPGLGVAPSGEFAQS